MTEENTAEREVSMRLEVEVSAVVEAEFTTEEELLAWLAKEENLAAIVGLTVSYMEANGTDGFPSTWLDENREVYLKEVLEVDLWKVIKAQVKDP